MAGRRLEWERGKSDGDPSHPTKDKILSHPRLSFGVFAPPTGPRRTFGRTLGRATLTAVQPGDRFED